MTANVFVLLAQKRVIIIPAIYCEQYVVINNNIAINRYTFCLKIL